MHVPFSGEILLIAKCCGVLFFPTPRTKEAVMFVSPDLLAPLRAAKSLSRWARDARQKMIDDAKPWLDRSDENLWHLMFGPTITRSWDVWSTGFCPTCRKPVVLYNWIIDAHKAPWKVTCPECKDVFPKNDFHAFYKSGLDEHNIFSYAKADRSLLFNTEHPDPKDPLHLYAVDDGEGYLAPDSPTGEAEHRWRFVGAYLVYGQWKTLVYGAIVRLGAAYAATGDRRYAHKAGVLLDRVADLYPSFDNKTQAWVEEIFRTEGYVSTWHDACEETREIALTFDLCRDAIAQDRELAAFLDAKSKQFKLGRSKATPADVCRNIEDGLLRDPLIHQERIHSNYPRREIATMVIHAVLGWPTNRAKVMEILDGVLKKATAVDGVTGEKGLAGYSAYVIQSLANFLAQLERLEPGILATLLDKYPKLRETYRFHIDTWVAQRFYPQSGDTGWFASRGDDYCGVTLHKEPSLSPSMYWFLWKLYEATGDHAYVQTLYHNNGRKLDGLPYDLFVADEIGFQRGVDEVIARQGPDIIQSHSLKRDWRLAVLRSGRGKDERAIWIDFDSGGAHGHQDGLNIGLFAKDCDLMPDLGYPPLQFSRANGPHVAWYLHTASHNTVVIDGKTQLNGGYRRYPIGGSCTLWAPGRMLDSTSTSAGVAAIRVEAAEIQCFSALHAPVDVSGAGQDRVGLYSWTGMSVSNVRVWTKPEAAPEGDTGWTLTFEDSFNRNELGPDWHVLTDGNWRIEGGRAVGKGTLMCTRSFPGRHRIEYEAWTDNPKPSDLSAILSATAEGHSTGAFFGFGTNDNTHAKVVLVGHAAASDPRGLIVPGKRHRITSERDGTLLRMIADGNEILHMRNTKEDIDRNRADQLAKNRYERTLVAVDISDKDTYYVDVTRTLGGRDHAKFMHSHFATITTQGLNLSPAEDYGHDTLMRSFKTDRHAKPGWQADWKVIDHYQHLAPDAEIHLRYTDLSENAEASTCEGWVCAGHYNQTKEAWIPRIMVRRRASDAPLATTFAGVIEPYDTRSGIAGIRRLALTSATGAKLSDSHAALEVTLADGRKDLIIARDHLDAGVTGAISQGDWSVQTDAEAIVVRKNADGSLRAIVVARGKSVRVGGTNARWDQPVEHSEITHTGKSWEHTGGVAPAQVI